MTQRPPNPVTDVLMDKIAPTPLMAADGRTIRPLYDRVLIRDIHDDEHNPGGVVILPQHNNRYADTIRFGIVVAVGPGDKWFEPPGKMVADGVPARQSLPDGTERIPVTVQVGDKVLYKRWRGAEVEIEGQRMTLVHEDQGIIGIVE